MDARPASPGAGRAWSALWLGLFVVAASGLAWLSMTTALVAIVAVMLATIYHRASALTALAFGPLTERLRRQADEADRLTERLRDLAVEQGRAVIASAAYTGRFASGETWIYTAAQRVEAGLKEMGVPPDQLAEARSDLIDLTIEDAGRIAMGSGRPPPDREAAIEWRTLVRQGRCSDPAAVEGWLRQRGYLTPDREVLIADMQWMIAHRAIRDTAQYLRAHLPLESPWAAPAPAAPPAPMPGDEPAARQSGA